MEDGDEESVADLTRLLDSEQPDPGAAQATIVPYLGDIYMAEPLRRPRDDYIWTIQLQEGNSPNMRATLVDWLVDVADEFKLLADTLHLAVSYVDRFLTVGVISQNKCYLVWLHCLLLRNMKRMDLLSISWRNTARLLPAHTASSRWGVPCKNFSMADILRIHYLQLGGAYSDLGAIKNKYKDHELEYVSTMASPEEIPAYYLKDIKQ